jgi:Brp/Blh family beta-carotene 15,15'-monooxygenase
VLLPLTAPAAAATLVALEPRLSVVTDPSLLVCVRAAVLVLSAVASVALVRERRTIAAAELALLVALALAVTPLVAFAVYFAGWHAARHTLRLALDDHGRLDRGRLRVVLRAGAPSLAVAAAAVAAALVVGAAPAPTVLWLALAAVWGLTVPHMAVVGALGARRRRGLSPRRPGRQAART